MLKIRFFVKMAHVLLLAGAGIFAQTLPPGEVQEFAPGIVSTGRGFTVTFSPDGHDVYFTSREESDGSSKPPLHIYRSHLSQGAWQPAKPVSFSSPQWSDLDPFVTVDGRQMLFVSTRPAPGKDVAKRDMDIWVSDLRNGDWAEPRWIEEVNSTAKEGSPSLDRHGNLYFFSDRESEPGHNAIYVSHWRKERFSAPEKLSEPINAGPSDTSPWIFPNGKALLFYSTRPGGYGKADLYVSFIKRGKWTSAQNLGPVVNTAESEYNPSISRDGRALYFGRGGKTYFVPLDELHVSGLGNRPQ
jgi:Tol biopolymer transport system component